MNDPMIDEELRNRLSRELAARRLLVEMLDEIPDATQHDALLQECHKVLRDRRRHRQSIRFYTYGAAASLAFLLIGLFMAGRHEWSKRPSSPGTVVQRAIDVPDEQRLARVHVLSNTRPKMAINAMPSSSPSLKVVEDGRPRMTVLLGSKPTLDIIESQKPAMVTLKGISNEEFLRMTSNHQIVALVGYSPDDMSAIFISRSYGKPRH